MRYPELRKKLREQGFINIEIAALHMQYLVVKALGLDDSEIVFDRENGLLMDPSAKDKCDKMEGVQIAPDVQNDCVYIVRDDGHSTKLGPF